MSPRLKALADALDAIGEYPGQLAHAMDRDFCREGSALIRSLSDVEPVGYVYTMEALVPGGGVKHHAQLTRPLPAGTLLFDHPTEPKAEAPQAPAEGVVYPCVRITVDDDGKVTAGSLYAPGLPAGTFNVYPIGIEDCATGAPA